MPCPHGFLEADCRLCTRYRKLPPCLDCSHAGNDHALRAYQETEREVAVGGRTRLVVESTRLGDERDRRRGLCEVGSCPCGRYRPGEESGLDLSGAPEMPGDRGR
mgnify:CR=1 FL=1